MPDFARSATDHPRRSDRPTSPARGVTAWPVIAVLLSALMPAPEVAAASDPAAERFGEEVQPILEEYCYGCHGERDQEGRGGPRRPEADEAQAARSRPLVGVLKNVRAGIMPPADKPQPSDDERRAPGGLDQVRGLRDRPDGPRPRPRHRPPAQPRRVPQHDPRPDRRRLRHHAEFPPDDTGHGFDNIGDVLTLSPLLLEKYLAAANAIVVAGRADRAESRRARRSIPGRSFRRDRRRDRAGDGPLSLSYYEPATVSATVPVEHDGRYQAGPGPHGERAFRRRGQSTTTSAGSLFRADGEELAPPRVRPAGRRSRSASSSTATGRPGRTTLTVEVQPLTPDEKQVRSLTLRIQSATVRGPMDERYWVRPPDYERFFPGDVPDGRRRAPALRPRAARAVRRRRPSAAPWTTRRRTGSRRSPRPSHAQAGQTFEAGVAQAMAAVLASPRFLFREEAVEPGAPGRHPARSTNTPWPRGCPTSSGRRCPTTS